MSRVLSRSLAGLAAVVLAALLAACSLEDGPSESGSGDGDGDGSDTGSGPTADQPDFGNVVDMPTGDGQGPAGPSGSDAPLPVDCVAESQGAEPVDVDMYIMLDRSGSMIGLTGSGDTKWDAIRAALRSFVEDPASAGLGVGLQYFPLAAPGVPERCMDDAECGMLGGPCTTKACRPPPPPFPLTFGFTICLSDSNCPVLSGGCVDFGVCSRDDTLACFDIGPGGCNMNGDCAPVAGECLFYASCDPGDYSSASVPIDVLPDNADALTASLAAQTLVGLTPTRVALHGAINHAARHAQRNPSHRVVAVLATDGLPTDCPPTESSDIADLASMGLELLTPIETYVIGVFAPEDLQAGAQDNLDDWASAGGTDRAFIVDPTQDVAVQFREALDEIRAGTLDCEFQLPAAPGDASLDFDRVNVALTDGGQERTLVNVDGVGDCGAAELEWYYDADPRQGQEPTKIIVCDRTCDAIQSATDAMVDIKLGCETRRPD